MNQIVTHYLYHNNSQRICALINEKGEIEYVSFHIGRIYWLRGQKFFA